MNSLLLSSVAASALASGGGGDSGGGGGTDPDFASVTFLTRFETDPLVNEGNLPCEFSFQGSSAIVGTDKKFGTKSVACNIGGANNDYVILLNHEIADFENGDWTAELWLKCENLAKEQMCFGNYGRTRVGTWGFYVSGSGDFEFWYIQTGFSLNKINLGLANSGWHHFAACFDGATIRVFIDGVLAGSSSTNLPGSGFTPGSDQRVYIAAAASDAEIYVDEIRLTKGVARYSANFTPPTDPFPRSA